MLRITTTLLAAAALLLGCPEAQTTECSPKAGECPNYCTDGTGVAGESCAGPSDCGCGLACISGSCTAYTGANEGCGCPSQPQPDAAADAGVPDTPAPDTGPTVQPWDDGCDKIVEGADCNPYCQAGCDAADRHCAFSGNNFECRAFGAVAIDGECADSTDCEEGLSCFGLNDGTNMCRKPCIDVDDCPGDRPCNLNVNFPDFSASFCGLPTVGCDPFQDATTACGDGNACYYGNQATQCMAAGSAPAGTDCYGESANLCASGLQCIVECQQACSTDDSGTGEPKCSSLCTGEVLEISAENSMGVCLTDTVPATCDIWTNTGCDGGDGCYRVQGGIACLTAGSTAVGEACQFTNDCVPGSVCVSSQCQELCDATEGETGPNACDTKCQSSNNLTPTAWNFGICTDAAPADPCDFWAQDCSDAGKTCYQLQNGASCLDTGGSAAKDEACSGVTDCAGGLICYQDLCREPCHTSDFPPAGAPSCPQICGVAGYTPISIENQIAFCN